MKLVVTLIFPFLIIFYVNHLKEFCTFTLFLILLLIWYCPWELRVICSGFGNWECFNVGANRTLFSGTMMKLFQLKYKKHVAYCSMQLSMKYYQFFPCTLISCTCYLISVLAFIRYPPKTLWWLSFLVFVVVVDRMFFHLNQIYLHSMTELLPYCIHTEYSLFIKYLLLSRLYRIE